MPNTSDNLPGLIGQAGGVPQLRATPVNIDVSGHQAMAESGNRLSRGFFNATGALVNLKNEEDMTRAKQALIDANNELDTFMAEEQQKRGVNAAGAVERLNTKTTEIRERYGRDLDGVGRKVYQMQFDHAKGVNFSRALSHQTAEADRAQTIANNQLAASFLQKAALNPDDDSVLGNYFGVRQSDWIRQGIDPKIQAELYQNEIRAVCAARVSAQLKNKNLSGAKTLLERYKPDSKAKYRLDQASYDSIKKKVDAYAAIERPYQASDSVFTELAQRYDFKNDNPTVFFQAGRDSIRKALTGNERDKALELYNSRVKEYDAVIKQREEDLCASFRTVYRNASFVQASEYVEKQLLEIQKPQLSARIRHEMNQYYGTEKADGLSNRRAMDETLIEVKKNKLSPDQARDAFIRNGGNCDDASLKKLERAISVSGTLPDVELVNAVSQAFGYQKIPGGFYEYLVDLGDVREIKSSSDIRRMLADYLATEVTNENILWDTNSSLGKMQGYPNEIYLSRKQMSEFYLRNREVAKQKNGNRYPDRYREAVPSGSQLSDYAARFGFYLDRDGDKYRRNVKNDNAAYEQTQKQLNKRGIN